MTRRKLKNQSIRNSEGKGKPKNMPIVENSGEMKPDKSIEYGGEDYKSNKLESNHPKKNKRLPDIKKLEKEILEYIIGQDEQVRQIITSIYRGIKFKSIKANMLVIGGSGTGKTATMENIAKKLHIPYVIEDATKYTQEGYYGADVKDMIYDLIESAGDDIKRAENGIIVIDEIDKKSGVGADVGRDSSGVEVLKSLLKIIEGTTIKVCISDNPFEEDRYVDFNTRNLIIIFLGAFSGLEKIRDKRLNVNAIGFGGNSEKKETRKNRFLKQDLVKYGMPEEFVGHIDTIVEMNKLTKEDLTLILKKAKSSIFRRYQAELRNNGITLSYDGKLFECIAAESMSLDTGARELSNTVNYIFERILYDVLANPGKYTKCTLSMDIVKDNTKYELS